MNIRIPRAAAAAAEQLEDPLAHLPCSNILDYRKGQLIYDHDQPASSLFLVIDGMVKISRLEADGRQVVVDIYKQDEFFGESAFLRLPQRGEQASALEATRVMAWTATEIESIILKRPRLALALLQILTRRGINFVHRIEVFSVDTIQRRLARSLIGFSERFGTPGEDGGVHMAPFTHELLAQYIGTSREITTHHMNQLRRQGYLRYSRRGITLYHDALNRWLAKRR